jgi:hypothetical protein
MSAHSALIAHLRRTPNAESDSCVPNYLAGQGLCTIAFVGSVLQQGSSPSCQIAQFADTRRL